MKPKRQTTKTEQQQLEQQEQSQEQEPEETYEERWERINRSVPLRGRSATMGGLSIE